LQILGSYCEMPLNKYFFILALIFSTHVFSLDLAERQFKMPGNVVFIKTMGEWIFEERQGFYRFIISETRDDPKVSQVILQWVYKTNGINRISASIPLEPINSSKKYKLFKPSFSKGFMRFKATEIGVSAPVFFNVDAKNRPGEYELAFDAVLEDNGYQQANKVSDKFFKRPTF